MSGYQNTDFFPPSLPDEVCAYRSPTAESKLGPQIIFRTNVHEFPEMEQFENLMSNLNNKFYKQTLAMESFTLSRKSAMSQESAKYRQQLEIQEREHMLLMQRLEQEEAEKKKILRDVMEEVERNDVDTVRLEKVLQVAEQKLNDHPGALAAARELLQQCKLLLQQVASSIEHCKSGDDENIARLSHILHHSPVVHRLSHHAMIRQAQNMLQLHAEAKEKQSQQSAHPSSAPRSPRRSSNDSKASHAPKSTNLPQDLKACIATTVEQACKNTQTTSDYISALYRLQLSLLQSSFAFTDVIQECFNCIHSSECSGSQEKMLRVSHLLYIVAVKVLKQDFSALVNAFIVQSPLCIPSLDEMSSSSMVSIFGAVLCVATSDHCSAAPYICWKWLTSFEQQVTTLTDAHVTILLAFVDMTTCVLSLFYGKRLSLLIQGVNTKPKSLSERQLSKLSNYVSSLAEPKPLDNHLLELTRQWTSDLNNFTITELRAECTAFENNKSEETKQLIAAMDMRRLTLAFNILGVETDTQVRALEILQDKFLKALEYCQPALLSYIVYKIISATLRQAQDEQFSVGSMGRVIAVIVTATSDIQLSPLLPQLSCTGAVYLMQFNKICPFSIPRFYSTADGDDYYPVMAYNKYSSGKWEENERWMNRMNKLIGTYAFVLIQPDCTYFTLSLAWQWIADVNNYFMNHESPPNIPSAKLIDTFLRVVSPKMMEIHGSTYVALISAVRHHVVPKMSTDETYFPSITHKKKLEDFLEAFISSNGRDCPPAI